MAQIFQNDYNLDNSYISNIAQHNTVQIQEMEALQFPRGNYYMIVCKAGNQALRAQENDPAKFEKSKIVSTQPNPQDNNQLFMVEKVGLSDDQYEIVSCPTTLVFDEQGKQIKLKYGKQCKDQLFAVVQAPVQGIYKYFWIKTDASGKQALSLQGTLKYTKFDANIDSQLFRFEQVANNTVQGSCLIINNSTGKALDVPEASWKKGERILQWEKNRRWNQRWRFVKQGKGVTIQSVLNNHVLDICQQKKQSGSKIIQWPFTGGTNQLWLPEPAGNGLYKIRSVHEGSLFLSIKHMDANNGGKLEVSNSQNPTMYWRIEGAQP